MESVNVKVVDQYTPTEDEEEHIVIPTVITSPVDHPEKEVQTSTPTELIIERWRSWCNLKKNEVWELVPRPDDHNVIGIKWIFKINLMSMGILPKRSQTSGLASGYTQVEGVDFEETFAPVTRLEAIRLLLSLACLVKFKLYQMDVQSAFLNGIIQEEVYLEQPKGFIDPSNPDHVYRLKKVLYGLKQAHRAWYERLTIFLLKNGYTRGAVDNTLFIKREKDQLMVTKDEAGLFVDVSGYRSMIGSLLYLNASRLDISHYVGICVRYESDLKESHSNLVKRLIKYIQGNNLVSWFSKKQNLVSFSTTEAEYVTVRSSCTQLLWMKQMLEEYGANPGVMTLYCDNMSAISIFKNPVQHSRTKHIDIKHHFIRELVEDKVVNLEHVSTDKQMVDILTKGFDVNQFEYLKTVLGLCVLDK
ncbi:transmembrane signal receptor [Lithospermum erythrorhizon]|uniref:Transmembrane signal receptor n=1 Tax=Lithospermum erythrorhizon TaxID=34254 RepID=A0AAV3PLS6_LITER